MRIDIRIVSSILHIRAVIQSRNIAEEWDSHVLKIDFFFE